MSGTPQSPDRKKPRPSNQEEEENEEEAVQRQPIFEDSSDEVRGTVPVQYLFNNTRTYSTYEYRYRYTSKALQAYRYQYLRTCTVETRTVLTVLLQLSALRYEYRSSTTVH